MKEHPILFSAPMVRALLEGRKTVTRRLLGPRVGAYANDGAPGVACDLVRLDADGDPCDGAVHCPYGAPGDRLWVRETFSSVDVNGHKSSPREAHFVVLPDGTQVYRDGTVLAALPEYARGAFDGITWRPSIHMPRWASRIMLEVVSVRAERLHEITEEDAKAEGVEPFKLDPEGDCWTNGTHRTAFEYLWNEIHGWAPNSWASNPWVWRVEFRRVS